MVSRAALAGIASSIVLMAGVGFLGPSAAVPRADRVLWAAHPNDLVVIALLWIAIVLGTVAALVAVRVQDRFSPRTLLIGGLLAVAVLTVAPVLGSTDMMDYATYGRITVLGGNPHVMTPAQLRLEGDPVALLSSEAWQFSPSVYGPVATATEWAAAELGGASAFSIVLWLKVMNGVAFVLAGLMLARLTNPVRAHLLWTVNPIMLWSVCAGGHIDGLATALGVGSLWLVLRGRGFAAGVVLGLAAAVKAPLLVYGVAARRPVRFWLGALLALVPGYLIVGPAALRALAGRSRTWSWMSPWDLLARWFDLPEQAWTVLVWGGAAAVAGLLLYGLPVGPPRIRLAFAISLAWVITTPIYHPWYDVMVFGLLVLMPASRLDWLLLLRAGIAAGCALPGVALSTNWLTDAGDSVSSTVPLAMMLLALLIGVFAARRRLLPAQPVHAPGRILVAA